MNRKKLNDDFDTISLNDDKKQEILKNILNAKTNPSSTHKNFSIYISVAAVFLVAASIGLAISKYSGNNNIVQQLITDEISKQADVIDNGETETYQPDKTKLLADTEDKNTDTITYSSKTSGSDLNTGNNKTEANAKELHRANDYSDEITEDAVQTQGEDVILNTNINDNTVIVTPEPEIVAEPEITAEPYEETKIASGGGSGGSGGGSIHKGGGSAAGVPVPSVVSTETPTPAPDVSE